MQEKYGVAPHQYPELAALVGETSDNLPGVPGVGPKTAAKWIGAYGGLEQILAQAEDVPGKAGQNLREHLDQVRTNRRLNRLLDDLEVEASLASLEYRGADPVAIHQMCDALQFRTLRDRLMPLVAGDAVEEVTEAPAEVSVVTDGALAAVTALSGAVTVFVDGRIGADADAWALGVTQDGAAWGIDLSALSAEQEREPGWMARGPVGRGDDPRGEGCLACAASPRP
ncbi:5'-3' exonuclease [Demequina litorisediminis]|uniref:5'-3' exonuclease n=1 Tax=Demequina litorisediminis TaxID=1849022 RepID=UPI003D67F15F